MFEQYRQTSQWMMNVHKQQFKSFEILSEETSFQMSLFLLSVLNAFIVGTEEYYPKRNNVITRKAFRSSITIAISFYG